MKLLISALVKFLVGLLMVALLIFLPAGTLAYPGGLLFLGLLFVPMLIMGVVLYTCAPDLLRRRLDAKEKRGEQKGVVAVSGMIFLCGFILAGLDFRFAWSSVPLPVVLVASVLFLVGYTLYAEVLRENAYLSRTVKVEKGQTVISTGLYGVVRHPMYTATILMFLSLPLVLGSWYALIPFAVYPILMIIRIRGEEKLLTAELAGYGDYKKKVRYRLIPFIW